MVLHSIDFQIVCMDNLLAFNIEINMIYFYTL